MTIEIPLTQGKVALIDDEDLPLVAGKNWAYMRHHFSEYATTKETKPSGGQKTVLMHRVITQCPGGLVVDHVNGNGLDNRRHNLRTCTLAQNLANRRKHFVGHSTYKGVQPDGRRWCAVITVSGAKKRIGRFATEIEAAKAYDAAAVQTFGEFARTNF